jgi:hypothetical protein
LGEALAAKKEPADAKHEGKPGKEAKGYDLILGPDDRTFALTRIDSKACESFKATTE